MYYEFRHFVAKFIVHLGVTFCEIFRCTNNVKRAAPFIVHLDLTPREEGTPAIIHAEQKSRTIGIVSALFRQHLVTKKADMDVLFP